MTDKSLRYAAVFIAALSLPLLCLPLVFWLRATREIKQSNRDYIQGKIAEKLFVRKCELSPVRDKAAAKRFIDQNHLFGVFITRLLMRNFAEHRAYGLYFGGELVYLCCFRPLRGANSSWDCYAMCSKINTAVTGAASKIMKAFAQDNGAGGSIQTRSIGAGGGVYERCGFTAVKRGRVFSVYSLSLGAETPT